MKSPSTAFAAIPETKETVMNLFAKSTFAVGLIASLSATSAEAFQVPALASADAAVAKVGYQSYYSAPSYGYGYNTGYSYGYRQSYGYRPSYGYGYRQTYGYRPSYGYNSYGY